MTENKSTGKRITIRIEESQNDQLANYMEQNNLNASEVIRLALNYYFEQKEKELSWLKLAQIK
jgi:antitoxin component of RelBE/YafQ-DinJ toxin-antitoxin module